MDTERGGNSREDKAVVSRKRHVMDNGLMFIFFFPHHSLTLFRPDALRI